MIWFFIALVVILAAVLILALALCRCASDADDVVDEWRRDGVL